MSGPWRMEASRSPRSLADSELIRQDAVSLRVLLSEIFQKSATLADEHEQAAARVVILLMGLEVVGQPVDTLGQEGDLPFRWSGIAVVRLELLDEALLPVKGQPHAGILPGVPPPIATPPGPWLRLRRDGFVW